MPYITQKERDKVDDFLDVLSNKIHNCGQLNYAITRLCIDYINEDKCYQRINDAVGVLSCSSQEIYRRIASHYEDGKAIQNGDLNFKEI